MSDVSLVAQTILPEDPQKQISLVQPSRVCLKFQHPIISSHKFRSLSILPPYRPPSYTTGAILAAIHVASTTLTPTSPEAVSAIFLSAFYSPSIFVRTPCHHPDWEEKRPNLVGPDSPKFGQLQP